MALPATVLGPACIEIVEPEAAACPAVALPPEGNVKLRNYRVLSERVRAYTPTGDVHTSPAKGKLVPRFEVCATLSVPRARILELLRPGEPSRDALEAIVRPAPRRLARPLDDDARRFLQRALLSPSPRGMSAPVTPEPPLTCAREPPDGSPDRGSEVTEPTSKTSRSLADELRQAERLDLSQDQSWLRPDSDPRESSTRESVERERLGKLALSVEDDEEECEDNSLSGASRRLDALLAESRFLHLELAGIQQDLQRAGVRAGRCAAAARRLAREARALAHLDDVLALLRGDVAAAGTARHWPFALGARQSSRNYVV